MTPVPEGPREPSARSVERAARALERGEPLAAYDIAQAALRAEPAHVRLRQLQALALARGGDTERANAMLAQLAAEGLPDAETLGMLARTHKDLALRSAGADARARHLGEALRLYEEGLASARHRDTEGALYNGINAAALAVLSGELARGRAIAREVRALCAAAPAPAGSAARYWREATLGEAALILGEAAASAAHYALAASLAQGRYGDLGSTRRQARLLAAHLPAQAVDAAADLAIPPVLAFTGNMLDAPGRASPRFPPALEGAVAAALRERIAALAPCAVYGSAACGVDLLCLEAARALGAETHVVLPFPAADFRDASVGFAGAQWAQRFDRALDAADSVTITSDHRASGSAATFEYANLVLTGLACLRSEQLDTPLHALAAWDPGSAGAAGGAGSQVALWEQRGIAVEHVDLAHLRGVASAPVDAAAMPPPAGAHTGHALRAMLFADAVGYSRLHEDQIPRFIREFLGAVGALNRETAHRAEHVETAGDGLYFVFAEVADAAHYALELSEMVRLRDWTEVGLPAELDLRIALHCGPVHCLRDPVTGRSLYTGPHASRAARIEPITPPGQVYASQAFAAVAAARGVRGLDLRYVGPVALAKGYRALPLYHVRRPAG